MEEINVNERFKKAIDLGVFTLKVAIIINAGAAVALLTFFGSLSRQLMYPEVIISINWAIRYFGIGVLSGAIAATASFFSEYYEFEKKENCAKNFFRAAVLFGIASLILFFCGIWEFTEAWVVFFSDLK